MENETKTITKTDLINSEDFDNAVEQAANLKQEILTTIKDRNKHNYNGFYDIMVMSDKKIEEILAKKKKKRSNEENDYIKKFKKETSLMYKTICDLLIPESLEEGEQSKFEKMVYKFALTYRMMKYITSATVGDSEFDRILAKYDMTICSPNLEVTNPVFENENIRKDIISYFENGRNIKHESQTKSDEITDVIYTSAVPTDLQFDKSTNPTGIKVSDFNKLVDIKTKLIMAVDDDAKDKVTEKVNDLAGDKQYEIARAKLVQQKIIDLIPEDSDDGIGAPTMVLDDVSTEVDND